HNPAAMSRRIALVLAYEGTAYAGFQLQTNAPSIQGEVEQAAERLTGVRPRLKGAGRTDAGVHAIGQVAAFDTESNLAIERFRLGLDHYLPEDIAVMAASEAPLDFDPRRHAVARVYRYTLVASAVLPPVRRRYVHVAGRDLDLEGMAEALAYLVGERDFAPFSGYVPEGKSTVRRMLRAEVWRSTETEDEVYVELEANAFLPQQVRRIVAAVLQTGNGRMTSATFKALADSDKRGAAAQVLPAKGLCLRHVKYRGFSPESHAAATDHQTH
ncbi:MAG: tRNA pseudouridine(38-40) synthase TruA, partial [Dehalococcoidia bacterium]